MDKTVSAAAREPKRAIYAAKATKEKFLGFFIFGAVWNVAVWYFMVQLLLDKDPTVFILMIFALPGLWLIWQSCVEGRAYFFGPQLQLTVEPDAARPGETVEIAWEIRGALPRNLNVGVWIEGRETLDFKAKGTSAELTTPFAQIRVLRTTNPADLLQGSTRITIPERAMHSFEAKRAGLQWMIKAEGGMGSWPKLEEAFPFAVLPADVTAAEDKVC